MRFVCTGSCLRFFGGFALAAPFGRLGGAAAFFGRLGCVGAGRVGAARAARAVRAQSVRPVTCARQEGQIVTFAQQSRQYKRCPQGSIVTSLVTSMHKGHSSSSSSATSSSAASSASAASPFSASSQTSMTFRGPSSLRAAPAGASDAARASKSSSTSMISGIELHCGHSSPCWLKSDHRTKGDAGNDSGP
eukprot:CAMPEP_0206823240 /NCGR_PEP_ID=MMETSP0975-20121206/13223_1 /ASSEMBLY_ACC=CAM_ASM_000399 /TAXON_ID=483370 /ORGANISM="non described non described, Strain CCMP2097" /LENGTH=190 /DNA_ID=CAMNT_0054365491 /DNA_START=1 /DNA_END=569 /DNA_ORIENTATION=-